MAAKLRTTFERRTGKRKGNKPFCLLQPNAYACGDRRREREPGGTQLGAARLRLRSCSHAGQARTARRLRPMATHRPPTASRKPANAAVAAELDPVLAMAGSGAAGALGAGAAAAAGSGAGAGFGAVVAVGAGEAAGGAGTGAAWAAVALILPTAASDAVRCFSGSGA